jgi:hypothetical protein
MTMVKPDGHNAGKDSFCLEKRGYELFSVEQHEKKVEKEWQTRLLTDLEQFIRAKIAKLKENAP